SPAAARSATSRSLYGRVRPGRVPDGRTTSAAAAPGSVVACRELVQELDRRTPDVLGHETAQDGAGLLEVTSGRTGHGDGPGGGLLERPGRRPVGQIPRALGEIQVVFGTRAAQRFSLECRWCGPLSA